jgi:hypothetical protein
LAYITGTASNHTALWTTLLDFLQTNATLVAAGQNWTKVWEVSGQPEVVMQSPAGARVALKRIDDALTAGESVIWMSGCTGVIPAAVSFTGHVNSLARTPAAFLDQAPMQYWMVANGRRFVVVIKISTVYQAMYGGFFLPYASPSAYPYPLFIGGTRGFSGYSASYIASTWRAAEADHYRHFVYARNSNGATSGFDSSAAMLTPDASWRAGGIDYNVGSYVLPRFLMGPRAFPEYMGGSTVTDNNGPAFSSTTSSGNPQRYGYQTLRSRMIAGINGEMPLTPVTLMSFNNTTSPDPVTYGILDGCFSVPGQGNTAESLITIGGLSHLVVPNVQRTDASEYWALALE